MPTINQLVRKGRKRILKRLTPALMSNPQKGVFVLGCIQLLLKNQTQLFVKSLELG